MMVRTLAIAAMLAVSLAGVAQAQMTFGGAPAGGGSIGANPDQRSGPYPAPGDSSAGNTMSPGGTLGFGQVTLPTPADSDTVVGPSRRPATPPPHAPQ